MPRKPLASLVIFLGLLLSGVSRGQESGSLKLGDLPPAVQVTVKEQSRGGTLKNLWIGRNKEQKVYGAVIMTGGRRKEVVVNSEGQVMDVVQDFTIESMPAAVRKTFKDQVQGAKILNTSKETESGAVKYVIETDVQGRSRNISIDDAGKVIQIEEQVALDTLPAAARGRVEQQAGKGKVLSIQMLTTGGNPAVYDATIEVAGKRSVIRVAADGSIQPKEN